MVGGSFDFRVTPNPNDLLDFHLDEEFDKNKMDYKKFPILT